jgi:hypothetical protein
MGTAAAVVDRAGAVDKAGPAAADLDMADLAAADIASDIQPAAALVSQADMSTLP